jgi:hypothetical protein
MRYFKRFIAGVAFCAVGAIAVALWMKGKTDDSTQLTLKKTGLLRLINNASDIQRMWIEGEESREWLNLKVQCLKDWGVTANFDESLLRCSPLLLECHARHLKNTSFTYSKIWQEKKWYRYLTKSNTAHAGLRSSGVTMTLEDNESKETLDIFLEDQCHEVYLEQRAYAYGEPPTDKEEEDYRFDNFNQNIYFDRHLVTNAEINDWIEFGNPDFTKTLNPKVGNELFTPATHLTLNQMENYCSFKGKQLMLAHLFDAATFLPMDLAETVPNKNQRSPYYWTKKKSEFEASCKRFFANECLAEAPFKMNQIEPSWAGMMDSMGGVFEVFRNPIDPESNLKASSMYFPFNSTWHKLGFRAEWDGEGFELRNFDFRGINPEVKMDKFQVGFRCMREEL